jgi:hypothetical protein
MRGRLHALAATVAVAALITAGYVLLAPSQSSRLAEAPAPPIERAEHAQTIEFLEKNCL